jgi:hypothetical protein
MHDTTLDGLGFAATVAARLDVTACPPGVKAKRVADRAAKIAAIKAILVGRLEAVIAE